MDYRRITIERVGSDTYDVSAYIASNNFGDGGHGRHLWTEQVERVKVGSADVSLPVEAEMKLVARTGFMSLDLDNDFREEGGLILNIDPE